MMHDPSRQGFAKQFFPEGMHLLTCMVNSQGGRLRCTTAIHFFPDHCRTHRTAIAVLRLGRADGGRVHQDDLPHGLAGTFAAGSGIFVGFRLAQPTGLSGGD